MTQVADAKIGCDSSRAAAASAPAKFGMRPFTGNGKRATLASDKMCHTASRAAALSAKRRSAIPDAGEGALLRVMTSGCKCYRALAGFCLPKLVVDCGDLHDASVCATSACQRAAYMLSEVGTLVGWVPERHAALLRQMIDLGIVAHMPQPGKKRREFIDL